MLCDLIVSKNDIPVYEAEVGSALKVRFFQWTPRINVVSAEILFYVDLQLLQLAQEQL